MSSVIQGESHKVINRLVRQFKGRLTPLLQENLRRLRIEIERVLGGEDNVKIDIYISDELDDPECIQIGNGENKLVFDVEEDGIDHKWTKQTLWRKIKNFVSKAGRKIGEILFENVLLKFILMVIGLAFPI